MLGMLCGQSMISLLEPRDTQRILILLLVPAFIDESCFTVLSQDDVSVESENKVNIRRGFSWFEVWILLVCRLVVVLISSLISLQFLNERLRQHRVS